MATFASLFADFVLAAGILGIFWFSRQIARGMIGKHPTKLPRPNTTVSVTVHHARDEGEFINQPTITVSSALSANVTSEVVGGPESTDKHEAFAAKR